MTLEDVLAQNVSPGSEWFVRENNDTDVLGSNKLRCKGIYLMQVMSKSPEKSHKIDLLDASVCRLNYATEL